LVGQGSFGSVLLVRRKADGAEFVMKRLPIQNVGEKEMEAYQNEIRLLSELVRR
jgi:serine/threonine protein kinase